jgi:peptide/nickel transport system permease protein
MARCLPFTKCRALDGKRAIDGMIGFLFRRLGYGLAVLVAVTSLVFGLLHLSGDPVDALVPPGSSPQQTEVIKERFGLDRPLASQYATFLKNAAQGDFGESWRARRPAMTTVLERLPATLKLAAAAIALSVLVGGLLGMLAGSQPNGIGDFLATVLALSGQAIPGFWLGTLLILLFAVKLHWLPSSGDDGIKAMILPTITLAAYPSATIARLLRSSLMETMNRDYIRTARGKGLSSLAIVWKHALKNAALPTLAFVGLQAGFLIGGAIVVEGVFAYPGIGQLALQSVSGRDLPIVQAFVVVVAIMILLIGLIVDLLTRILDPRLREFSTARGGD